MAIPLGFKTTNELTEKTTATYAFVFDSTNGKITFSNLAKSLISPSNFVTASGLTLVAGDKILVWDDSAGVSKFIPQEEAGFGGGSADFDSIVVDVDGNIVTHNGYVVVST